MGRRKHIAVSLCPGCHGNSCLTVEYPPVQRSFVVADTSLFGCGGGVDDDDNVHHVLSMYFLLDRTSSTVFSSIVIALVDFVLSRQGEIKFYLFQCV